MTIETRPIEQDETDAFLAAVTSGFYEPALHEGDLALRRQRYLPRRWWAALDEGTIVATVRAVPLLTTMVGGVALTSCGITAVTTASTHRRRGLMHTLLTGSLREGREQGEPLATLIAAEYPIYGRFGFGPATEHATTTVRTSRLRWRDDHGDLRVSLVDPATLRAEAPAVHDRHRVLSPGEIERDDFGWNVQVDGLPSDPRKGFQAICRDASGAATGYVQYTVDTTFDGRQPNGTVKVEELVAADPVSERTLWRYVCAIDWARTVQARNRRVEERLPLWLDDGREVVQTERADFVWARPLDVPACLAARAYGRPVDAVIEVVDPLGLSNGRVALSTDGAGATCTPTDRSPDVTMPVDTLGAVLLGGSSLHALFLAGRADEHTPGAVDRLTTAFRGIQPPWTTSWF